MRAIGTYVNRDYYPLFVTLVNSIKHNEVNAEIKLYDYLNLNHLLKSYASKFSTVVALPTREIIDSLENQESYRRGCGFRPLTAYEYMNDVEIFVDADMLILSDMEEPFSHIESGYFVGSKEFKDQQVFQLDNYPDQQSQLSELWLDVVGYGIPQALTLFNGGFLGLSKKHHDLLLKNWAKLIKTPRIFCTPPYDNDQNLLSALLLSMGVDTITLDSDIWMNTWHKHQNVITGFEKGKLSAYRNGNKLKMYHYTGGVGITEHEHTGRFYFKTGDYFEDNHITNRQDMADAWDDMWENKYESSAGEMLKYFYDKGPMKVPKIFNFHFKSQVARVLSGKFNRRLAPGDPEVTLVTLAYDYVTLLDYYPLQGTWLSEALRLFVDYDKNFGNDTISLDDYLANVVLSLCRIDNTQDWGDIQDTRGSRESLYGVSITILKEPLF